MIHTLEADGISLEFDNRVILSDVYIRCDTGKITGLLGRNGQGKTCLMRIIYGELPCERSIRFNGVSQYEAYKKKGLLLYLPQFNFIPGGLSLKRVFKDFELDLSEFENTFPEFKLRSNHSIRNLPGGERRLAELYVVLKSPSQFAMFDEPFTHLSPLQIQKVKDLFKEEKDKKGLLITDHLFRHVVDISDTLYVLANGNVHLTKGIGDIESLGYARAE